MAAVLLLVFLPALAAVGFILGSTLGALSWSSAFMGLTFVLIAGGIVVGTVQLAKSWDAEEDHGTARPRS